MMGGGGARDGLREVAELILCSKPSIWWGCEASVGAPGGVAWERHLSFKDLKNM